MQLLDNFSVFLARKLPNYLRTYRKRAGLSQEEVAFLLGAHDGTKISRYEQFARLPTMETLLACELLFRVPPRELFPGVYEKVEQKLLKRARTLADKLAAKRSSAIRRRKLKALNGVVSPAGGELVQRA